MPSTLLAELGIVCSRCDGLNDAGAVQCSECGEPLSDASSPAAREPAAAPVAPRPSSRPTAAQPPAPREPVTASVPAPAPKPKAPPPNARPASPAAPPVARKPLAPPVRGAHAPVEKPLPAPASAGKPVPAPPAPIERPLPTPNSARFGPAAGPGEVAGSPQSPLPASAPPPAAAPKSRHEVRARLVVVRGANAGSSFRISGQAVAAGAAKGLLLFPDDPFLSPLHATFFFRDGKLYVKDEGGPSGTYVRVHGPETLAAGAQFAVGDHLLRYIGPLSPPQRGTPVEYGAPMPAGPLHAVEEVLEGGRPGRGVARVGPVISVGRSGCDLSFANDAFIAPRHCELALEASGATLRDLGSPDGSFVRLAEFGERLLVPGDTIRLGLQILRAEAA